MKKYERRGMVAIFEEVSCFYVAGLFLSWGKYPKYKNGYLDSLSIFLEGYAFERQGRNPGYSHAAVDVLRECKEIVGQMDGKAVWNCFSKKLGDTGLNIKKQPVSS